MKIFIAIVRLEFRKNKREIFVNVTATALIPTSIYFEVFGYYYQIKFSFLFVS